MALYTQLSAYSVAAKLEQADQHYSHHHDNCNDDESVCECKEKCLTATCCVALTEGCVQTVQHQEREREGGGGRESQVFYKYRIR